MTEAPGGRGRRLLRAALVATIVCVSVGWMVATLRHAPGVLGGIAWLDRPVMLVLAVLAQAVALYVGCLFWWYVLHQLAPGAIAPGPLWRIFAITSPTRYVPGRILHVASLGAMLRGAGVPVGATLTSLAVHMWLCVVAAGVVGALLVLWLPWSATARAAAMGAVLAGAALASHPALLAMAARLLARASREPTLAWRASWTRTIALTAAYVVLTVVTGLVAWLALHATTSLPLSAAPRVVAANAAAFLAGYISLVPAGLGVRDAIMALLLAPASSPAAAAADAVVLRLAATSGEVLLALAALAATGWARRRAQPR